MSQCNYWQRLNICGLVLPFCYWPLVKAGGLLTRSGSSPWSQIRITNPTFGRHVRDAPGGEEFMHTAGWRVKVKHG